MSVINGYWVITRSDTGERIELPQDVQWIDEFAWSATAQSAPVRTLSGGHIIQTGIKSSGRPITLSGDWVWHKRGVLETLRSWTDEPGLRLTLTHYDGRVFNVIFRTHDSAMSAAPVYYMTPEVDTEPYTATINLMTV